MIAVHRPVQERLQKEIDEFFDGLNGQPPTYAPRPVLFGQYLFPCSSNRR